MSIFDALHCRQTVCCSTRLAIRNNHDQEAPSGGALSSRPMKFQVRLSSMGHDLRHQDFQHPACAWGSSLVGGGPTFPTPTGIHGICHAAKVLPRACAHMSGNEEVKRIACKGLPTHQYSWVQIQALPWAVCSRLRASKLFIV